MKLRSFFENKTYYHGTVFEFDHFEPSTSDHVNDLIGPHFSGTPYIANQFALRTNRGVDQPRQRIILAHIDGEIYRLPQGPYEDDPSAFLHDIWRVLTKLNPKLAATLIQYSKTYWEEDRRDVSRLSKFTQKLKNQDYYYLFSGGYNEHDAPVPRNLKLRIAEIYRDYLKNQGYGVIEYINTIEGEYAPSMEDMLSYVALNRPRFKFVTDDNNTKPHTG